jgi:hypothetical protein
VLHLADGRVLVGTIISEGKTYSIRTLTGVKTANAAQVTRVERRDALLATYARLAAERQPDDGFAWLSVARWCREKGLLEEMWASLERARASGAPGLDEVLGELEAEVLGARQGAPVAKKVKELLLEVRGNDSIRDRAVIAILANLPLAEAELRNGGRTHWRSAARKAAVEAVAARIRAGTAPAAGQDQAVSGRQAPAAADDVNFLVMRTVSDASEPVRATSVRAVRELGMAGAAVDQIGPLMRHRSDAVRMRAAEALGNLGEPRGVEYLLTALSGGGGSSPRGHVAFLDFTSYIRDFDVEVAQAAAIADPVVDTVMSGVVLDAQVKGVSWERLVLERKTIRNAVRKLAGPGLPEDPKHWSEWWAKRGER